MVRDDRHPGADDRDEQQHVQEVLPADPRREARALLGAGGQHRAGVFIEKVRDPRGFAQALGHRDRGQQHHEAQRHQPQQVQPAVTTHPHPGSDPVLGRDSTGPSFVDNVVGLPGELLAESPGCRFWIRLAHGVSCAASMRRAAGRGRTVLDESGDGTEYLQAGIKRFP
ncbi:MAG: hypothetical protein WCC45_20345, partial [Paeniglutamicibacter sp.]